MPEQFIGANAEFWWKKEVTVGVPDFTSPGSPLNTTLAQPVQPGATSIVVADATNAAAGDIIRVGDDYNPEYVKIASSYTTGTTIPLNPATWINFQHQAGEIVKEVTPSGFTKLAALVTVDRIGELQKILSSAIRASRGTPKARAGNIDVNFGLTFELGIEGVGPWFKYLIGKDYTSDGSAVTGGGSTTVASAASAGATSLQFAALTNFAAGDFFKVGSGATQEVSRIDPAWNGTANPVPLDTNYPLRYAHASGEAIVEVQSPFTHTIKRGSLLSMTQVLRFMETNQNDVIVLVKGAKIASANTTIQPNNETVKFSLNIAAQSIQILELNLFGSPAAITHKFYAPWEARFKKDAVVSRIIESFAFTLDNQIDGGAGRTLGSRFRTSVKEGRGNISGSVQYQLRDAAMLKQALVGTASALDVTFTYAEDNNHAFGFNFPSAKFTGAVMPSLSGDGPIANTMNFDAEIDDTQGSDIVCTITTTEASL